MSTLKVLVSTFCFYGAAAFNCIALYSSDPIYDFNNEKGESYILL